MMQITFLSHHTVVWGIPLRQYYKYAYVSMGDTYHVCSFCTVTDFSAAKKDRGVKFCKRVRLLSGQVFSHLGGQRTRPPGTKTRIHEASWTYHLPAPAARVGGQSELGAAASRKAVWWDMRLASLLTHLLLLASCISYHSAIPSSLICFSLLTYCLA